MRFFLNNYQKTGQSLIELVIVIGLTSIFLPVVLTGLVSSREGKAQQGQRLNATALLNEANEAVRSVREGGWTTFAVNDVYHPQISGNSWTLQPLEEELNGFTRKIEVSDVYRDTDGAIVASGGRIDPSTKKVITTVSWNTPFPSAISSTGYLTRYLNNLTSSQTTEADFNQSTGDGIVITNDLGGEIQLGIGGGGSWCDPNLSMTAFDLPKQGVANGISAIEGWVFAGTGDNASGESYAKVQISNDKPPVATLIGTFSKSKTNGVFGETNYGYIATDTNSKEIIILDIASLPYTEIGYFNSPDVTDANSIFVTGNTGYMTAGNVLYNFDLTQKTDSRPALDSDGVTLSEIGNKVTVVGNYAYVASSSTSIQLQIIDVSNPANLTIVGQAQVDGLGGKDIFVNSSGTRAYLVTDTSLTQKEFFIIDITTKTGDRPTLGSYDSNGMNPKGVTVVPGNRAIIVGTGGEEYQVIKITDETNPTHCGGLNIDTGINGLSSVLETDGDAYSYIITGDAGSELKIIEGGPGGSHSTEGWFESHTFIDPGFPVAFNHFTVNSVLPILTSLRYQMAAADSIDGSCSGVNFSYVGPDGTGDTYFSGSSRIPFDDDGIGYENPGSCFRYKIYFSTQEITMTPVFYDITVNYSP
ncbi:hypothetical protein A2Y99_02010 [Candidatus Gottesmanbacteria bacterium RBG_13_37_7]|uniref:Uncharacterized protein n=1 Tax=Candidatus Gottesmanbacteria bacterium RBG_13_37_7 TaxID=1798369 RepID=A0A1F5YHV1_9BACT|nr:MAG: hypothetical protein A2Y99_02010 [Candidatus Gottesmanbacteria bacterium RBG_13_37_7]